MAALGALDVASGMKAAVVLVAFAIMLCACASRSAGASSAASSSPASSPTPASSGPSAQATPSPTSRPDEVLSIEDANGTETVRLVTVTAETVTEKLLYTGEDLHVWDAGHGIALVTVKRGTHLATLDLHTGAVRDVGYSSPNGIGPGVALSPDGTSAVVSTGSSTGGWEIDAVDLARGTSRRVRSIGPNDYSRAGLVTERWLPDGLLVSPGVWDCARSGLLSLDLNSGSLTHVADGEVGRLSPSGTIRAYSEKLDLGDGPYAGQCGWHNRLVAGPLGNEQTVIRSEKSRDIFPLSLMDDGTLLYVVDGAPLDTGLPAADTGLYLYDGASSVREFGEDRTGQWQSGVLLGSRRALVARQLTPGGTGTVEVDFVRLCDGTAGCQASSSPVETVSGHYPYIRLMVVRP